MSLTPSQLPHNCTSGTYPLPSQPQMVYAFPVTAVGSLVLVTVSAVIDHRTGPFGWFWKGQYVLFVLYLSISPGIAGHTFINAVVRHLRPLEISLAMATEPVVGSVIGCMLGVQVGMFMMRHGE